MGRRAITGLLQTFYDNSVSDAVAAMLSRDDARLSAAELDRLAKLIAKAREDGR
jgi:hypothetical protein